MSIRNAGEIATDAVRQTLKAERARVRRLVKKLKLNSCVLAQANKVGYLWACDDLLTALKEKP
jgi:hypothetical protein